MITPSEYGHHQGSSTGSVRFPNPSTLESSVPPPTSSSQQSSSQSYNAFVGGTVPYPRCNTNALRRSRHFVPNECKDEYYWHKRLKNNEAARKSRQKRRNIDSVLEEKVLVLSHENDMLRNELYNLKVKYGEISPHDPKYSNTQPLEPSPSDSKGLSGGSSTRSITTTPDVLTKHDANQQVFNRNTSQDPKLQLQDPAASAAAALHKAMAAKNAAAAAVLQQQQQSNVMPNKPGTSGAGVHIATAQGGMQFPSNLLLSHLASGTYVLSPVSPNGPQNLLAAAGSQLMAPVSQQTIVTVQQNPITAGQQRDGAAQLVGFPGASAHQVAQLPVQATSAALNTIKMQQQHHPTAAGSLVSPRDISSASPKDQSDNNSKSSSTSSRSMFSFEQVVHEQQQRQHRKSAEQQQYRHRKNSRQQQQQMSSSSNEQPMNLEFKQGGEGRSSQTLATQTSPVSYFPAQTPPTPAGVGSNRSSLDDNNSQPSSSPLPSAKNLITGFMPIQAEVSYNSGRKPISGGGKKHYRDSEKDTRTSSESSASGMGADNCNSRSTSTRAQSPEDLSQEGDFTDTEKRLSPSPHHSHHEESYQAYRKAFHKIQDEQDFEAATTLATLSKRSKLHHLEPSSYSMDSVSSNLQAANNGDDRPDDERKHRLPHKLRFKLHSEGPQEGEQPSKLSE